jgi:hypothetical protein
VRTLLRFGHTVRLMAPQFVKPYVKKNKIDVADAEAICEAVIRPNMRFVPIKNIEQVVDLCSSAGFRISLRWRWPTRTCAPCGQYSHTVENLDPIMCRHAWPRNTLQFLTRTATKENTPPIAQAITQ